MEIVKASKDYTKKEIYNLTRSPEIKKLSDQEGEIIPVEGFLIFTDTDQNGNETEIMSILSTDGAVYASNSQTANREMLFIHDLMDGEPYSIKVIRGNSKNGRKYTTVALA